MTTVEELPRTGRAVREHPSCEAVVLRRKIFAERGSKMRKRAAQALRDARVQTVGGRGNAGNGDETSRFLRIRKIGFVNLY